MHLNDAPIQSIDDDKLDRAEFVQRLSQTIMDWRSSESMVIGIYGPWGAGKSSVLNLLEQYLAGSKLDGIGELGGKHQIVRFDPWFFNSTEQLLRTFFATLEEAVQPLVEKTGKSLKDTFRRYAGKLSFVSVSPEISIGPIKIAVPISGNKPGDETPEKIRAQLTDMLKEIDGRVIVMIDNLDRLDPLELMLVFKLVRLCSDFPNFIYLLAFDRKQVIDLLDNGLDTDEDFLEKIIQVDIDLPMVDRIQIDDFVVEGIEQITQLHEIDLDQRFLDRFGPIYRQHIKLLLSDLRTAKRYLNACAFSLPLVKREVNYADFLALEAVRVFFPTIYHELPNYEVELTSFDLLSSASGDWRRRDRHGIFRQFRERIKGELNQAGEIQVVEALLGHLFPILGAYFSNPTNPTVFASSRREHLEREQNVASPTHFGRYFKLSVPSTDLPTSVIQQLISGLNDTDRTESPESFAERLREFKSDEHLMQLLEKLLVYSPDLNPSGSNALLKSISQISATLSWEKEGPWKSEATLASDLAIRCLSAAENPAEVRGQLTEIIRNATALSFAAIVVWKAISLDARAPLCEGEDRESVVRELEKRINGDLLRQSVDIFESYPDSFHWVLKMWRDTDYVNQPKEASKYVYEKLGESAQAVGRLLSAYVSTYAGTGEPSALSYSKLLEIYDAGTLHELISKHEDKAQWNEIEQFAVSEFMRFYHESPPQ